jgi:hypothetical protein
MILRAGPEQRAVAARWQFPALWWLVLGAIALAIFVGGAAASGMWRAQGARAGKPMRQTAGASSRTPHDARKRPAVRVRYIFALAGFAVALMIGCGGSKIKPLPTTPVTPTGVTSMTILGNATDASGNALGTSRSLQVTLDVVTQ